MTESVKPIVEKYYGLIDSASCTRPAACTPRTSS